MVLGSWLVPLALVDVGRRSARPAARPPAHAAARAGARRAHGMRRSRPCRTQAHGQRRDAAARASRRRCRRPWRPMPRRRDADAAGRGARSASGCGMRRGPRARRRGPLAGEPASRRGSVAREPAVAAVRRRASAADGGDDLKRIKGVGPKLEALLHSLGIYHFDQIAAWGPAEVAWVDCQPRGLQRPGHARRLGRAGEDPGGRRRDRAFAAGRPRRVRLSGPGRGVLRARLRPGRGNEAHAGGQGPDLHQPLRHARPQPRGARARGQWDGTAGIIGRGPRQDRRGDEGERAARPRRRGLPDRAEVVVHAQGSRTGGRTIWWSTPTNPSPAPARTGRSCATTRTRWSRAA